MKCLDETNTHYEHTNNSYNNNKKEIPLKALIMSRTSHQSHGEHRLLNLNKQTKTLHCSVTRAAFTTVSKHIFLNKP